jgi:hypothetical protein
LARRSSFVAAAALGLLVALTVSALCAGQQSVAAPGGVAVGGNVENSTITVINNQDAAVLAAITKTFTDQIAATAEAKVKAETKAAELAQKLGFTASAVAEFFKILGEQNVPEEKIPARLTEIATHFTQTRDERGRSSRMIRTRPNWRARREARLTPAG